MLTGKAALIVWHFPQHRHGIQNNSVGKSSTLGYTWSVQVPSTASPIPIYKAVNAASVCWSHYCTASWLLNRKISVLQFCQRQSRELSDSSLQISSHLWFCCYCWSLPLFMTMCLVFTGVFLPVVSSNEKEKKVVLVTGLQQHRIHNNLTQLNNLTQ